MFPGESSWSVSWTLSPATDEEERRLSPPCLIGTMISVSRIRGGAEKKNRCVPLPKDVFDELRSFSLLVWTSEERDADSPVMFYTLFPVRAAQAQKLRF